MLKLYLMTNATYFFLILYLSWEKKPNRFCKSLSYLIFLYFKSATASTFSSHVPNVFMLAVSVAKPRASATHFFRAPILMYFLGFLTEEIARTRGFKQAAN